MHCDLQVRVVRYSFMQWYVCARRGERERVGDKAGAQSVGVSLMIFRGWEHGATGDATTPDPRGGVYIDTPHNIFFWQKGRTTQARFAMFLAAFLAEERKRRNKVGKKWSQPLWLLGGVAF